MKPMMDAEDLKDGGADEASEDAAAKGHNAGMGNRAVASHIKNLHANAGKSGNSVSSMIGPKSTKHAPGAASSVLKTPRTTAKPIGD